ncbi:YsnF/AvaK domain-containing protein [Skermanella rosea]|uniref:YsnF/AvaK domain-containing protein n=1 Tax=Skermanella rosea TaxID=1817965 RepID=UPI001933D84F|nr:YsnF/AvaK domain-containing protein [Skermanella rosea]UEM05016.1 YsnF/AvaK domain-containing protein [Skermanella rosea]
MTKTVVALYDSATEAESVTRDLSAAGFTGTEVIDSSSLGSGSAGWSDAGTADPALGSGSVAAGVPGITSAAGMTGATGSAAASGATSGGILSRLRSAGVPEDDSHVYAEGVRRGGSLVIARLADDNVERGLEIMSNHGAVDIDERGSSWRSEGWSRYDENAGPYTGTGLTEAASSMRTTNTTSDTTTGLGDRTAAGTGEETVIPIAEEQIAVGKRQVQGGGVRVRSYVVETPVEESVRLREESVHVERRAVDRPVDAGTDAFRERTVNLTETSEEAVVSKTARVTEEVVVGKDVTERTEHVSDTVRRTEVDVDRAADTDRTMTDRTATDRAVDRDRDI